MNTNRLNGKHHYVEVGRGQPVVLLHGMASSLHSWDYLIPGLTRRGHKVYALDLLGHGRSYKPKHPEDYHIQSYYRHFVEWLEATKLSGTQFSIVGHSMGAYLSLLYALAHPQQLKRLVLVDPFYSPEQMSWRLKMSARRPQISAWMMRATPAWLAYPFVRYNPAVARQIPARVLNRMARDYGRVDPNIVFTAATTRDLSKHLPEIQTEALVIWGEKDPTLAPNSFPRLVRRLPAAQARVIPHTGHLPHLAKAGEVQGAVFTFLNGD